MKVDVIFQDVSETMKMQMTEDDDSFEISYEESMTLMGPEGKSAYQLAVENGYKGTESQWLASLIGDDGYTPRKGVDYYTETEKQALVREILATMNDNIQAPKIGVVKLLASAWVGNDNLYHQIVDIDGVTENSQVDLTPDVHQLAIFYDKDLSFVTENEGGTVTVYAIGQKPTNDYSIQVTITEVDV